MVAGPRADLGMIVPMLRWLMVLVLMLGIVALVGCAKARDESPLAFDSNRYSEVFQDAKDIVREFQFELDRVDARSGLITTQPRTSAGLATPWVPHSSGLRGSIEGLIEHERRVARVRFLPAGAEELPPPELFDLREFEGQLDVRFEVEVQRIHRPHRRVPVSSVRLTTYAVNPMTADPNLETQFSYESLEDEMLASRMLQSLRARLSSLGESND